jgi:hypothetical protein
MGGGIVGDDSDVGDRLNTTGTDPDQLAARTDDTPII